MRCQVYLVWIKISPGIGNAEHLALCVESMQHVVGRIAAVSEPSGILGWRAGSSMNAPPPRRGTPAIQSASPAAGAQEPGIPAPAHPHTFPGQGWRQGLSIHFTSFKVYVVLIDISSSNYLCLNTSTQLTQNIPPREW